VWRPTDELPLLPQTKVESTAGAVLVVLVRSRHSAVVWMEGQKVNCKRCDSNADHLARGLCRKCYRKHAFRYDLADGYTDPDQTEAELDAMIAEQLPTMPGGDMRERQLVDVPRCVAVGRGFRSTHRREIR
jgi:hypothetical protein